MRALRRWALAEWIVGLAMMGLWLVRHGETALNAARVLQPADTPLSDHGVRQAEALAERMTRAPLAGILSSDLPRAEHTARVIARHTGHTVQTTRLLHERNFGDWRGLPYDGLRVDPLQMDGAPPGGESAADFAQRCQRGFDEALCWQRRLGGLLVVVTHGLVIRQMLMALPPAALASSCPGGALPRLGNTSVTVLDGGEPHTVRLLNCVRHLGGGLEEKAQSLSGG